MRKSAQRCHHLGQEKWYFNGKRVCFYESAKTLRLEGKIKSGDHCIYSAEHLPNQAFQHSGCFKCLSCFFLLHSGKGYLLREHRVCFAVFCWRIGTKLTTKCFAPTPDEKRINHNHFSKCKVYFFSFSLYLDDKYDRSPQPHSPPKISSQ